MVWYGNAKKEEEVFCAMQRAALYLLGVAVIHTEDVKPAAPARCMSKYTYSYTNSKFV